MKPQFGNMKKKFKNVVDKVILILYNTCLSELN